LRKLIKGDEVIVITGRDKGKTGVIDSVVSEAFIIKGVNLSKKHQKPNPNKGIAGGIVQIELPIHRSNLAIYNKSKKAKDKVLIKKDKDGNKTRLYRSNEKKI
jgi:large subunit ribosomal protein L24